MVTILPSASRHHQAACELAQLEDGGEVDLDRVVPVVELQLERRTGVHGAVARDEHVEPAQSLDRLVEATPELIPVGEIGPDGDAVHARGRFVGRRRSSEHGDASRLRRPVPRRSRSRFRLHRR